MKRLFAMIAIMLLSACSNEGGFLESLEGQWREQGKNKLMTIKKIEQVLVVVDSEKAVWIVTPNGKFASDTNRLPVKVEIYTQWPSDMIADIVAENIGKIHRYNEQEIGTAIGEVRLNSSDYSKITAYDFLQTMGVTGGGDFDMRHQAYLTLISELESQKPVIKAPSTLEAILQLGSNGQIMFTDENGKSGMNMIRERALDYLDTERMMKYKELIDTRATLIDQAIDAVINKYNEDITKLKKIENRQ